MRRHLYATWLAGALLAGALVTSCGSQGEAAPVDPTPAAPTAVPSATPAPQPDNPVLGKPFTLKIGQSARIASESLAIEFSSVLEDSRCPTKVDCAWSGRANVSVAVSQADQPRAFYSLITIHGPEKTDRVSHAGYEIRLVGLTPRSEYPDKPVDSGDYVVELEVAKQPMP
jgi:hypothetical protein